MTNTNINATMNERWSAMSGTGNESFNAFASPRNTTATAKNSDNLRQMMLQDFGRATPFTSEGSSSQCLLRPMRKQSKSSFGSMSTISSAEGFPNHNNHVFSSSAPTSSKNNLLRYNNMDSKGSLGCMNNRWRATPSTMNNSNTTGNQNTLFASLNMPIASGNHQKRWMATLDSDRASDQPMGMITRKRSASIIFPASSA